LKPNLRTSIKELFKSIVAGLWAGVKCLYEPDYAKGKR
jgi:hypothetical protein